MPKRKRALCPLPFWFIIQKGFEAANSKRASDAFAAAGFFVAEREAAELRRLRDSMREKGFPASVPKKSPCLQGFFFGLIIRRDSKPWAVRPVDESDGARPAFVKRRECDTE